MFCNKCGKNNPDTASFCTGCGERLPVSAPPLQNNFNAQNTQNYNGNAIMQAKANKNNKKLIIGIVIAVVAVIIIVASVFALWLFGGDKDSGKSSASSASSASSESSDTSKSSDSSESSTTSKPSTTSVPKKDFTADMTAEEFAQEVTELLFYGKYDKLKKYFLIEEMVDYFPLEEGMEDLEHVLEREGCIQRTNEGIGYEVIFEHYSTDTKEKSDLEADLVAVCKEYSIDIPYDDVDYSKITEIYCVDIAVEVLFDDDYADTGDALLYVVRCGDSWRCALGLVDM